MSFEKGIFAGLIAGITISTIFALLFQITSMLLPEFFQYYDSSAFIEGGALPIHLFIPIIWGIIFGIVFSKINLVFKGNKNSLGLQYGFTMWTLTVLPMILFLMYLVAIDWILLLFWGISLFIAIIFGSIVLVRVYTKIP